MRRMSWCKPNLHLKARSRDNEGSKLNYDHGILRGHKICDYMGYTTFKMIIFNQFRHALTRHDPKTYLIWCEAFSVTLGFDVPSPSPEDSSTPHFDWYFRIYFLHGSSSSWVHSEIYYLIIYPEKMSSICKVYDPHPIKHIQFKMTSFPWSWSWKFKMS